MKVLSDRTLAALVAAFVAPTTSAASAPVAADPAPATATCPDFLPAETRCWTGRAAKGGFYWIAVPKAWNGAIGTESTEESTQRVENWRIDGIVILSPGKVVVMDHWRF